MRTDGRETENGRVCVSKQASMQTRDRWGKAGTVPGTVR